MTGKQVYLSRLQCALTRGKGECQLKRNSDTAARAPRGRLGNVLLNLLITLIAGAVYFYVAIPAINLQSGEFYSLVFML